MQRKDQETCVYCLSTVPVDLITVDHVIARSWYPSDSLHLLKWKAPACIACNNTLGRIENDVLCRLAMCANPRDRTLEKIITSAKRSLNPAFGKSQKDKAKRESRRQEILSDLREEIRPDTNGVLPAFHRNFFEGSQSGIQISAQSLKTVGKKWMRGLHYWKFGDLIPIKAKLDVFFVTDEIAKEAFGEILQFATALNSGPGIQVLIFDVVEGNERITQYAFKIWREFTLYGSVNVRW